MKIALTESAAQALTFQRYGPQPALAGVAYLPLKKHRALDGSFMEYLRITDDAVEQLPIPFSVRQVSFAQAVPGRINAFHLHPKATQDELWTVIAGALRVWLVDVRQDSPTCGVQRQFVLTGEEPALLYIPTGVAHGYQAGVEGATLVYAMNAQFDIQDPNEGRLPWDFFGAELWEADRG